MDHRTVTYTHTFRDLPSDGPHAMSIDFRVYQTAVDYAVADIDATECEASRKPGAGERRKNAELCRQRLLEAVIQAYGVTTVNPVT